MEFTFIGLEKMVRKEEKFMLVSTMVLKHFLLWVNKNLDCHGDFRNIKSKVQYCVPLEVKYIFIHVYEACFVTKWPFPFPNNKF